MRRHPVSRWAETLDSTEEEMNGYLEELGYQYMCQSTENLEKKIWIITEEGKKYCRVSRNPFSKRILWDMDALFQVMKLRGKKTGKYHCHPAN